MDSKNKLIAEIREANLSYMMLAQALIRLDRPSALLQLGLNEEVAQIVEALSPTQIIRLAQSNMLMCRMRFDDRMIWSLLSDQGAYQPGAERSASRLHASILMAGQVEDAF
jgi:flagellar transcriptional activator FlhD